MEFQENIKEITIILISALILGAVWIYPKSISNLYLLSFFFLIIIATNILAKKYIAYKFEVNLKTKFWSVFHYGFKKGSHFRTPVYMLWFPILLGLISRGLIKWLPLLEFDFSPRIERVARRHEGVYRFTEVIEWHMALIVMWGLIANLALAIIGYIFAGYLPQGELFAKLNIYYCLWNLLPISNLDGSKMFFGSRPLWWTFLAISLIFFIFSLITFT